MEQLNVRIPGELLRRLDEVEERLEEGPERLDDLDCPGGLVGVGADRLDLDVALVDVPGDVRELPLLPARAEELVEAHEAAGVSELVVTNIVVGRKKKEKEETPVVAATEPVV